jgi:hypothetical protein
MNVLSVFVPCISLIISSASLSSNAISESHEPTMIRSLKESASEKSDALKPIFQSKGGF